MYQHVRHVNLLLPGWYIHRWWRDGVESWGESHRYRLPPNPYNSTTARTSSVARKAAMSWVGSFWMKPTVSVRRISGKEPWNCGSASLLWLVSLACV